MSTIELAVAEGIATLTLSRPQRKNALNSTMQREFHDALQTLRRDDDVKALVLTGAGGDFCAGGDISDTPKSIEARIVRARLLEANRIAVALRDFNRPVISAVDGVAYGAGFSIALLSDFVVASERARFCLAFSRIGLVPDMGLTYTLPRAVGMQKARELIYSAREVSALEAQKLGIVLDVCPQAVLVSRACELARAMSTLSPDSFTLTRSLLASSFESDFASLLDAEATAQAMAATSPYLSEALGRFTRNEPPLFQWPPQGSDR